jgi:serine/threonine-protein kinase
MCRAIVHGDLKPENIRITSSGAVRILDFGSATAVTPGAPCVHSGGLTREYASPERLATHVVDARTDLWAVGIILYEALTGSHPDGRPDVRGMNPALARIVTRSLALADENRYPSAAAMARDLDEVAGGVTSTVSEEIPTGILRSCFAAARRPASAAINAAELGWNEM